LNNLNAIIAIYSLLIDMFMENVIKSLVNMRRPEGINVMVAENYVTPSN
jgi:hypothetical protein